MFFPKPLRHLFETYFILPFFIFYCMVRVSLDLFSSVPRFYNYIQALSIGGGMCPRLEDGSIQLKLVLKFVELSCHKSG